MVARAWGTIRYGESSLTISSLGNTRTVTVTHQGGAYPGSHVSTTNITLNVAESTTGLTPPGGVWGVAVVEDGGEANQNYTVGGVVMAYAALGNGGSLPSTINLTGLNKGGHYRIVLMAGDTAGRAQNAAGTDTGGLSAEYHLDSDGGSTRGGLAPTASGQVVGAAGHRVIVSAVTPTAGSWKYGQTNQIAVSLRPAGSTGSAIINPKQFKVALSVDTGGDTRPDGVYRITPNTTGDATATGIRVDTDFSQALGGVGHYTQIALNNRLGDSTTPAAEAASDYSIGTVEGVTTSQRSAYVFATTGHAAGLTFADTNRIRKTAADVTISSGIQIFEDAGKVTAGVITHQSSARTTRQDIYKRTGPTNLANARPYMRTFVFDAYGNPLTSTAVTGNVLRTVNDSNENSQSLTTDANGRIQWNYTLSASAPAFNRYVKASASRVANGHVAAGPDSTTSWTYNFANGNPQDPTTYPGPFPGYPRDVQVVGRVFGSKEPTVRDVAVFGVNSEPSIEAVWTGSLTAANLDGNGVPQGAGKRGQQLGAGSLKAKFTSKVDPASLRVTTLGRHALRDGAGREISVTTDNWYLASAAFNDTLDAIHKAAGALNDSQTKLENSIGYNANNNSLDTIAPPTDPASIKYFLAAADTTGQRNTFDMTINGVDPVAGFTGDSGNFGYYQQVVSFEALDSSIVGILTSDVIQSDPTLTRSFTFKAVRIAADAELNPDTGFNGVNTDGPPVYAVFIQPTGGGALEQLEAGTMTAIGTAPTPDWEFEVTVPLGYKMAKVFATARVNGSPIISGSKQAIQIGYEFDAVGTFVGFHYK